MDDHEPIRKLMRDWTVTAPLPPRFNEGVWRRIEQSEASPTLMIWLAVADWVATVLPRPTVAVSYVTMLLLIGISAGHWQVRNHTAHVDHELGARYVQSVDPYQKPRS